MPCHTRRLFPRYKEGRLKKNFIRTVAVSVMWLTSKILISANLGENKTLLKYIVAEPNGKNLANYLLFAAMCLQPKFYICSLSCNCSWNFSCST